MKSFRDGVAMPQTEALLNNKIRPLNYLSDYHICIWETLTNGGSP